MLRSAEIALEALRQFSDLETAETSAFRPLALHVEPESIAWSPDGRWLAFVAHHELFVASPRGEVRRIGRGWSPTWVPGST